MSLILMMMINWQLLTVSEYDTMHINDQLDAAAELIAKEGAVGRLRVCKVDGYIEVIGPEKDAHKPFKAPPRGSNGTIKKEESG